MARKPSKSKDSRKAPKGALVVGYGIAGWDSTERRSNRYGSVHLRETPVMGPDRAKVRIETEALQRLQGKCVRLIAEVVEARESTHLGDVALQIVPTRPEVGEQIDLGVGILGLATGYDGLPDILLRPRDGRSVLWIDPRKLYRIHDQTVRLYAVATRAAFTPAPELEVDMAPAAYHTGHSERGTTAVQFKNVQNGEEVRIPRTFTPLGHGRFMLSDPEPGPGGTLPIEVEGRGRKGLSG